MVGSGSRSIPNAAIIACAVVAIVLGVALRFFDLGRPLFWQDEAYTALRTTGHLESEYRPLFDGGVHGAGEIRAFVSLDSSRGVADVVRALAAEDPQHPPLFYVLERCWIGAFGSSATAFRSLSAIFGAFGIALAFALGNALLRSRVAGAVGAGLFALSPLFVLYARQAREYALFADATLLATLALIPALRAPTLRAWTAYAACVTFGLYTDPLFLLVGLSHALTTLLYGAPRLRRLRSWALATLAGAVPFAPWALNAARSGNTIPNELEWAQTFYPLKYLAQKWLFNLGALAFDGEFRSLWLAPLALLVVVAIVFAAVVFVRRRDRLAFAVIAPLVVTTFAVVVVRDVVEGAHFATIPRYLIATWIGLELVLATALWTGLGSARYRTLAFAAWVVLLVCGIVSGAVRGGAENWWDNNDQVAFQAVARQIDRANRPLVITQGHWHVPLVLVRYLRDDAAFLLFRDAPPAIPSGRSAFLISPTNDVLRAVAERARGRYALANVSPASATIIGGFHRGLVRASPAMFRGNAPAFVPQNALWSLRPRTK